MMKISLIVWTLAVVYICYLVFNSKLDQVNNMLEVHAHAGYYNACMEETKQRYKCMDRAKAYTEKTFGM